MTSDTWQLVLVDVLFLCIAAGLGLWIRSFLREERLEFDRRLGELDAQSSQLEQLGARLQSLCLKLENQEWPEDFERENRQGREVPRGDERSSREDPYEQAWKLLGQGMPTGEVARRLGLGVAEVELMSRILRHKGRS